MAIGFNHSSIVLLSHLLFSFLIVSRAQSIVVNGTFNDVAAECVYTVYIRTGNVISGGTDSIISLRLYNAYNKYVDIPNLEAWGGLLEPGHDYFESGNLDIFSGRGICLGTPVCAMNLTSSGSGHGSGWFCDYVEVTTTGPHIPCSQQLFNVDQWIASDAPPFSLTAFRNYCPEVSNI